MQVVFIIWTHNLPVLSVTYVPSKCISFRNEKKINFATEKTDTHCFGQDTQVTIAELRLPDDCCIVMAGERQKANNHGLPC